MNRLTFAYISFFCGLLMAVSCGKGSVTPGEEAELKINILETSVAAVTDDVCGTTYDNVLHLTSGTPLILTMKFSGPHPLAQYKIDIHSNFDCHAHERPMSEWSYLKIEDISGLSMTVTEEIPLPADAFSGNYHCIIRLIDEQGNEAPFAEFNLVVSSSEDNEAPVISYTLPASDSIVARKGDLITFKGRVTDNHSLQNGKLEITYRDASGEEYTAINESFPEDDTAEHIFERTYEIPPYIAYGISVFRMKAFDRYNNSSETTIKIHITE